jgi:hypothetical protein
MDTFVDAVVAIVGRPAAPWVGMIVLAAPLWLLGAVRLGRALRRRQAFRAFAAAHPDLQFVGTKASDARLPYTRIDRVRRAVLLSNVVEGQWDGLPIRLFDMPIHRGLRWTAVLVTVEDLLRRGAWAEQVIAAGPAAMIETNLDVLLVSPTRLLDPGELTAWLAFATALAKAMERDAKERPQPDVDAEAPTPSRSILGLTGRE